MTSETTNGLRCSLIFPQNADSAVVPVSTIACSSMPSSGSSVLVHPGVISHPATAIGVPYPHAFTAGVSRACGPTSCHSFSNSRISRARLTGGRSTSTRRSCGHIITLREHNVGSRTKPWGAPGVGSVPRCTSSARGRASLLLSTSQVESGTSAPS